MNDEIIAIADTEAIVIDLVMPSCRLIIEPDGKERLQILINGVWIDVPKGKK